MRFERYQIRSKLTKKLHVVYSTHRTPETARKALDKFKRTASGTFNRRRPFIWDAFQFRRLRKGESDAR